MPEQGAFAATAAAHDDERLASMNVERDIIEHCAITESPDEESNQAIREELYAAVGTPEASRASSLAASSSRSRARKNSA